MITRRLFTKDPAESWASIAKGLLLCAIIGIYLAFAITS
jgi:hypothetical protein